MEKQIEELKAKMERSSQALVGFERELNVINPEEKTNILSARLLQLNTEFTNAEARPAEKRSRLRLGEGRVDRGGSGGARRATDYADWWSTSNDAREHFADVKTHFGANHPEYKKGGGAAREVDSAIASSRQGCRSSVRDRIG